MSDKEGLMPFFITKEHTSSSLLHSINSNSFVDKHNRLLKEIKVRVNTLDNYAKLHGIQHIDILKMDVQGGELNVLKGAINLLINEQIDIIYTEIWFNKSYENQPLYENIAIFLQNYNFHTLVFFDLHYDMDENCKLLWGDAIFIKS